MIILSTVFAFISPIIGIISVLKGTFRPQRMTRFLIMLLSFLFVGTLLSQNDKTGIYIASAQLVGSIILFFLSIKRGLGGTTKFDYLILFLTLLSFTIWQTTQNPFLGLIMSILTDLIAFLPTLIKTWRLPHTEDWRFYLSDVLAGGFSLLSFATLELSTLAFPLYIFLINLTSVLLILYRLHHHHPQKPQPATSRS